MKYNKENKLREEWRPIKGYEGLYEVSSFGRIKRLPLGKQWPYRRTHNNIRKVRITRNGYCRVNLSKGNIVKCFNVHRLVAMAFIPNPDNLPQVNHKDENKLNNKVENLEWCTQRYNNLWGTARQRQNETRHRNDPNCEIWKKSALHMAKKVAKCSKDGEILNTYPSMTSAANETGVAIRTISHQCNGKSKSRRNYYWRYV